MHVHPGTGQHVIFTLLCNWIGFCHGQILIETATHSWSFVLLGRLVESSLYYQICSYYKYMNIPPFPLRMGKADNGFPGKSAHPLHYYPIKSTSPIDCWYGPMFAAVQRLYFTPWSCNGWADSLSNPVRAFFEGLYDNTFCIILINSQGVLSKWAFFNRNCPKSLA